MYEGLGKIAIDATPGSKYNPKWPSRQDISRERLYTYLGWLVAAGYECVFVHYWASGKLPFNRGFFTAVSRVSTQSISTVHLTGFSSHSRLLARSARNGHSCLAATASCDKPELRAVSDAL